ncbi:unnamed protein product [Lampetra fluviatilis]
MRYEAHDGVGTQRGEEKRRRDSGRDCGSSSSSSETALQSSEVTAGTGATEERRKLVETFAQKWEVRV